MIQDLINVFRVPHCRRIPGVPSNGPFHMPTLALLLAGVSMLPFLWYQYRVMSWPYDTYSIKYVWHWRSPSRTTFPFYTGLLLLVAVAGYGIVAMAVPGTNSNIAGPADYFPLLLRCLALCVILVAKGYFGPAVAGYVVSSSIYLSLNTGHLQLAPVFSLLLDWVFGPTADAVEFAYTIFVAGNGLLGPLLRWRNPLELAA
jgi:hypothetical protein